MKLCDIGGECVESVKKISPFLQHKSLDCAYSFSTGSIVCYENDCCLRLLFTTLNLPFLFRPTLLEKNYIFKWVFCSVSFGRSIDSSHSFVSGIIRNPFQHRIYNKKRI